VPEELDYGTNMGQKETETIENDRYEDSEESRTRRITVGNGSPRIGTAARPKHRNIAWKLMKRNITRTATEINAQCVVLIDNLTMSQTGKKGTQE